MTVSSQAQFETVLDGIHFGECLRWRDGLLFFVDMYGDVVKSLDPATGEQQVVGEVFHPGGIGWLPDGRMLAVASEDKKVFEVGTEGNEPYADLSAVSPGWTNDMIVGRDGRLLPRVQRGGRQGDLPRVRKCLRDALRGEVVERGGDDVCGHLPERRRAGGEVPHPETPVAQAVEFRPGFRREIGDGVNWFDAVEQAAGENGLSVHSGSQSWP